MAPVCTACRLTLLVFVLFILSDLKNGNSLRAYDRQTLLAIRSSYFKTFNCNPGYQVTFSPPFLPRVPLSACLCYASVLPQLRGCRRRRGNHSGLLVRVKTTLAYMGKLSHTTVTGFDRVNYWPSLDMTYTYLTSVVEIITTTPRLRPFYLRLSGVNSQNLRPIGRAPTSASEPPTPLRISLANARSLANKTFILKDFFTNRNLDLMLVTETWLRAGESSCFTELLPSDCEYLNLPRMGRHGGGVAAVFRKKLACKQV